MPAPKEDALLAYTSSEDLIKELMRRTDTLVLGLFDPQTASSARFVLRSKGDQAWANLVVDALKDFMAELRANCVTERRHFSHELDEKEECPDDSARP